MRSNPAKRRGGDRPAGGLSPLSISPLAMWRVGAIVLWGGTFAAVAYGVNYLATRAHAQSNQHRCRVEWTDPPAWLSDPGWTFVKDVVQQAAGVLPDDSLDEDFYAADLCERVAGGLRASAWIRDVHRVVKRPYNVVRIDAVFRQPLAAVIQKNWAYLVDEDGVCLPLPERMHADEVNAGDYFLITGVRAGPPAHTAPWSGDDVAAGLRLVKFLERSGIRRMPLRSALRAVDVANYDGKEDRADGRLRIRTIYPRTYIQWGLAPGDEYDIETAAERKLDLLRQVYERDGRLPEAKIIDLRPKGGFFRDPR